MPDVFISYSRKDKEFVRRLEDSLERRGRETWVDWQGIRPTEEFMRAIYSAIETADTFVFVLTPDSVASAVCAREIAHAAAHNKRMVPIVRRDVNAETVPEALAKLNWIFCRDADDFEKTVDTLITAFDTDLEWVHDHTRLLTRAIEWETSGRNDSFVLRKDDLRDAERWLTEAGADKERQPTPLQTEYIIASRKAAARSQQWRLTAALSAVAIASILAGIAFYQWNLAEQREKKANDATLAAREQLFHALFSRARAGRFSGQMGQRFDALQALTEAAQIRFDEPLRDEATVVMALPDFRPGPSWNQDGIAAVDESYKFSAKANAGGLITVQSVPDGREVGRIESKGETASLVFSKDGRFLAQSNPDLTWRVWRWADAHFVLDNPLRGGKAIAFSPDNRHVAIGQGDQILRFDLATGKEVNRWKMTGVVHALAFHPDSRRIAVGHNGPHGTSICDAANGKNLADLPIGPVEPQVLAWHPDGIRLAIAGSNEDPRIQIWSVKEPESLQVASLAGHVQLVTVLSFHPDGELLGSAGWEGVCRIWNPSSGRQLMQSSSFNRCAFSADGRWFGGIGAGDKGKLLEVASPSEYRTLASSRGTGQGEYHDGAMSPDGRLFAFAMDDGVRIWDPATWRELAFLPVGDTRSVIFQPDGRELLTCGAGGLRRWPIQSSPDSPNVTRLGPSKRITLPSDSTPTRASRDQDGRTLAVVCEFGGGTFIVDLPTEAVKSQLLPHSAAGFVALSPDGQWMASSGWHSDRVRLWKAPNGTKDKEWTMVKEFVPGLMTRISFTPDSRSLIISRSQEFVFRDVVTFEPTKQIRSELPAHPRDIVFSPDGKLMAVALAPAVVQLRETASGRIIAKFEEPYGEFVTWMGFNADATQLLTASTHGKAIHAWDLRAIRARLKEMGLDWDWPEFPSSELPSLTGKPVRQIEVMSDD